MVRFLITLIIHILSTDDVEDQDIRITEERVDGKILAFAESHGMQSDLRPSLESRLPADTKWLVARSGDRIRAVAAMTTADDMARVGVFCVHRRYRRRGIGTLLLHRVAQIAKGMGSRRLMMTGVDLRKADAVGFLDNAGFRLDRDGVRMEWSARPLPEAIIPQGYELRTYQPGDEVEWANLINEAYDTTPNKTDYTAGKVLEKWVNTPYFMADGAYLVTHGGGMVGCFMAWRQVDEGPKRGRLHWLAVHPDHRRKGIAKFLTITVIRHLQTKGLTSIFLDTGYNLKAAMKMYRALGFVETPRLFDYVKDLS